MYNINRKILKIRYELGKATFIPNMCNLFPLWFTIQVWYQNSFCRQKHYIFHRSLMFFFFTFACIIYSICTYNTMFANWVITWWKMFSKQPDRWYFYGDTLYVFFLKSRVVMKVNNHTMALTIANSTKWNKVRFHHRKDFWPTK